MTDTPTTQAAAVTQADERYYIDCEFDGHNGPLLSLAMVRQDGWSIHVETTEIARDPWVVANVVPHMGSNDATTHPLVPLAGVGKQLIEFMGETPRATIIADSPVDIARFCQAISTASDGGYAPHPDVALSFEVHDVDCYPTTLPGAVQHNAWWDAMALRHRLSAAPARVDGDEIKATLEGKAKPKIGQGEYAYAKREQLPAMLRAQATDALLHEAAPHVVIDAWNIAQMAADELEAALATPQSPAGGEGAEAIVESIADMLDTAYDERDHVRHDAVAADIYGYVRDRLTLRAASPATDPDLTTAGEARVDKGASEALGETVLDDHTPAGESALREAAQFLSDRLDQLEWMDDDLQATVRDYMGHVDPAHDRLKSAPGVREVTAASGAIPAGTATRRQAQTIAAVLFEDTAAVGPMKQVHGEWLVREAMRLWPMWAGLRLFSRTSQRRHYLIATYHHPARLCWSWSLSITFTLFRRSSYLWPYIFGFRRDGNWAIRLPYLLELRWSRQRYDWMLSGNAKQRLMCIVNTVLNDREIAA